MSKNNNVLLDAVNCIALARTLQRRKEQNKPTPKFVKQALNGMRDKVIDSLKAEIEATKAELDAEINNSRPS